MARTGRPKAELVLTDDERRQLTAMASRRVAALALRSRIVLECAYGADNKTVAARLGCTPGTVGKWRARFIAHRLDGLADKPRPGRPPHARQPPIYDAAIMTSIPALLAAALSL